MSLNRVRKCVILLMQLRKCAHTKTEMHMHTSAHTHTHTHTDSNTYTQCMKRRKRLICQATHACALAPASVTPAQDKQQRDSSRAQFKAIQPENKQTSRRPISPLFLLPSTSSSSSSSSSSSFPRHWGHCEWHLEAPLIASLGAVGGSPRASDMHNYKCLPIN